ncbi:hypothetical protein SO802_024499 [Lithocarpus litseifolius]|uniref:Uncharacterized protein n=1 Tax=Lithocarpus litseifolius TaxID=425828 RepID=A0AAW2CAH0_9ROSI
MATATASGGLDGGGLERILDLGLRLGHRLGHNGARQSRPSSRSWPQWRLPILATVLAWIGSKVVEGLRSAVEVEKDRLSSVEVEINGVGWALWVSVAFEGSLTTSLVTATVSSGSQLFYFGSHDPVASLLPLTKEICWFLISGS